MITGPPPHLCRAINETHCSVQGSLGPAISMETYGCSMGILSKENDTTIAPYPKCFNFSFFATRVLSNWLEPLHIN